MYDDQYRDGSGEREEAESRIDRIRRGAGQAPSAEPEPVYDDTLDSDALSRARSRAQAARESLSYEEERPGRGRTPASRGRQGIMMIAAIVGAGVVVLVVIVLLIRLLGGGGSGPALPFLATDTPTPTPTPEATETPVPTETPTPTPTKEAPSTLALPPLTCIFQSGTGCFDYCQNADNASECESAKDFIRAQDADPDVWFECLAPESGPNVGNPQLCLEDAWRAANP